MKILVGLERDDSLNCTVALVDIYKKERFSVLNPFRIRGLKPKRYVYYLRYGGSVWVNNSNKLVNSNMNIELMNMLYKWNRGLP